MTNLIKRLFLLLIVFLAVKASAQTTTSSPYSAFGLGDIKEPFLPQSRSMGGISMGLRNLGYYNNINISNPASYSAIQLTTFDIGAFTGVSELSRNGNTGTNLNASLNHITFAIPVTRKSALSFGLLPFSELGYTVKNSITIDTNNVDYIYTGDGGLSKAYLGYGFQIGKHFSFGFNAGYLFGNLKKIRSTEFPGDFSALNSRTEDSNSAGGLTYDYGIQYFGNIGKDIKLTLGYAGNAGHDINSKNSIATTHYRFQSPGIESSPIDTTFFLENDQIKLNMPMSHTIGFSFEKINKWLIGADLSHTKWSDFRVGNNNPGLKDSYSIAAGGQFTPDATAVSSYLKLVDYRLGFRHEKTYINVNSQDIKQSAITFGLGLPLPSARTAFYKINFGAELGQRGSLNNNLVRERFVNVYLGFTLNDKWFIRPKYD